MTKSSTLLILFFLLAAPALFAQKAILTGKVLDANTQEPLIAATVLAGETGTVTEYDGTYVLSLDPGEYVVEFRYVGFETLRDTVRLSAGDKVILDKVMREEPNLLNVATITSGKYEKPLGEVTVSLEVIKPTLIENTNKSSVADVLDKVPGVNMVGGQANIRGGSGFSYGAGSRVLLLVDDMPILQADAGFPQWNDVPVENIEQIEVVKGAASALYGSSALNGIVNIRTAYAKSEPETKIAPFYTYFMKPKDKYKAWWTETGEQPYAAGMALSHKRKLGKIDLVTGGYYRKSKSVQDSTGTERGRVNIGLRYRINDRLSVGINANYNRNKSSSFFFWKDPDTLIYRPGVAVSNSNNTRYNIDPFLTWFDALGNRHKVKTRFFNVRNNTGTAEADQSNRSDVFYGEYQFQRKIQPLELVISAGLVYQNSVVRAPLYGDSTITSRNLAGYLQLDKKFGDRLNLSAGFRYERNLIFAPEEMLYQTTISGFPYTFEVLTPNGKVTDSKPVFRLGANYRAGKASYLRASWGQGYRFPTIAEKYIFTLFGGVPINPNPDLKPETGWTAELGLKQGFRISGFEGFFDYSIFWSEYQDMMEFNFLGFNFFDVAGFQSQNIGNTRIRGTEISVGGRGNLWGHATRVLGGYTYIDPKFKSFDINNPDKTSEAFLNAANSSICNDPDDPERKNCKNILKYRYKHTFKLDLESDFNQFTAGVAVIYNSQMVNIDQVFESVIVPGLREYRKAHANGDLLLNARLAYRISDLAKISLVGENLLNRETTSRPGQLRPTRNLTIRADFDF
ncbi:MAG: TonB-dependent receptor [Bacteroidetes bacterium]|nr:MAG: TonB-dependent receptor [Bacteroidota bacterium]